MHVCRGVLIRGGDVLEELAKVDTLVVDKTGTVTEGKPSVARTFLPAGASAAMGERELAILAGKLESSASASHPIARAIIGHGESARAAVAAEAEASGKDAVGEAPLAVEEVEYVAGKGVRGRCNGKVTAIGSLDWVLQAIGAGERHVDSSFGAEIERYRDDHTLVYVLLSSLSNDGTWGEKITN